MARRTAIDGDTGARVELDGEVHCFIVRLGDEQFDALERHRQRLERACKKPVSRAAAAREALAHALPRRPKRPPQNQLALFGQPLQRNPLVAVEAQAVAKRAAARLLNRP